MNTPEPSDELKDLIDIYLSGAADECAVARLESLLSEDASARHYFVRYAQMNSDLIQLARADRATSAVLDKVNASVKALPSNTVASATPPVRRMSKTFRLLSGAAAAILLIAAGLYVLYNSGQVKSPIAWISNAQNCRWTDALAPTANMKIGTVLKLESGLAEMSFANHATIILEGPASIELLSGSAVLLKAGKLTARVPGSARGFSIVSPHGKVIDLGTEFGISVAPDGGTEIYVFKGEVQALSKNDEKAASKAVNIKERQGAHIESNRVILQPDSKSLAAPRFVREITPPLVRTPRVSTLDFSRAVPGTLADESGQGTGLTNRFPGTGSALPAHDSNLKLNTHLRQLELTTTNSDINRRFQLSKGEYVGFKLSDLGFQKDEDFSITATIPNIPALIKLGQFGLYAGTKNDCCIRGGLIARNDNTYKLFMVSNNGGDDSNAHYVGMQSTGEDMRLSLRRLDGKYSLTVENMTTGSESTVAIKHPDFLDSQRDLYVGIFGANTQSEVPSTLYIKDLTVTVWNVVAPR